MISVGSLSRLRDHYDAHTHTDSRGGTTSDCQSTGLKIMADASHQWGSDLAIGATGDISTADGALLGQQRVLRRLLTNPGDYIWQLDYGAGLARFIGQPANALQIRAVIRSQIFKETAVAHVA